MPGCKTPFPVQTTKGIVWRNNTGAMRDKTGRHFVRFGINGMPDILGVKFFDGMIFGYEVKQPGESPTEMQFWIGNLIIAAGGKWGWGTSYDQCVEWQKEAGL